MKSIKCWEQNIFGKLGLENWEVNLLHFSPIIKILRLSGTIFSSTGDVTRGRQFYDVEGKELPGAPGYKYYGAAKDLPGVRELFAEKDEETEQRKQKK